jgi:hypothetical protein
MLNPGSASSINRRVSDAIDQLVFKSFLSEKEKAVLRRNIIRNFSEGISPSLCFHHL